MLFTETDAPLLKAWIVQRLANTSDADADVLADYVLALLRHDGDVESIRALFEEEIPDFLKEDSAAFTDDVFQAVKYRSYIPGAAPAPPAPRRAPPATVEAQTPTLQAQSQPIPQGPSALQHQQFPSPAFPEPRHTPYAETPSAFSNPSYRQGGKKRSYRDLDAPDPGPTSWNTYNLSPYQQNGPQPYKQARRGGGFTPRGGRFDDPYTGRGRGGHNGYPSNNGPNGYSPHQPFRGSPPGVPNIDPNTILENIQRLQELGAQMGLQMPQGIGGQLPKPIYSGPAIPPSKSQRKRGLCRDYESKGYCSRGGNCQFEHGAGSGYVPSFAPPQQAGEYDPNHASMSSPLEHPGQPLKPQDALDMQMPAQPSWSRREPKKPKRKGNRAAFSHEGPMHDKTKSKIVIENIPEEQFNEESIRDFFVQFGTIEEVALVPSHPKRIAVVNFDSWASANAAWKSPKVIFDNRFVKIYWYKDESQVAADSRQANGARKGSANGHGSAEGTLADPEFDLEEFKRKQEEAQKAHEEKAQKREAFEREKRELEQKRKELVAKQLEEKRKLQAKLATHREQAGSLSPVLSRADTSGNKPSQVDILRAKLAELEGEATELGLDPDAPQDNGWQGRGRGRGRGTFRGRGSFPPRASRGGYGYRGRGGGAGADVHAAYAAYSLDNRPKVVALTGVDFTDTSKDEALRQHLFGVGQFTAISTDPKTTHVAFKDRKTAEQFMSSIMANGKKVPGVEGAVELSWAASAPKSTVPDIDTPMASGLDEELSEKIASDRIEGTGFDRDVQDQPDMDYEAEEWDLQ